jgi:DnaJ-class molecular chaperone
MYSQFNRESITLKFRILGIPITSDRDAIKKAHTRLTHLYHPDKNRDKSLEIQHQVEERFKIIQNAYDFLKTNFEEIQQAFKANAQAFSLTSLGDKSTRSYWSYQTVSGMSA